MAHLKSTRTGTEIEVDEATAKGMTGDEWEVVGDDANADDKPARRPKASQKGPR